MVYRLVGEDLLSTHDRVHPVVAWVVESVQVWTRQAMKMVGKIVKAGLMRRKVSLVTVDEDVVQSTEENAYWPLKTPSSP